MWLGVVLVPCVCGTVHQCWQHLKPGRYRVSCNKQPSSWYDWKIVESDVKHHTHTHTHTHTQNHNCTPHSLYYIQIKHNYADWWRTKHTQINPFLLNTCLIRFVCLHFHCLCVYPLIVLIKHSICYLTIGLAGSEDLASNSTTATLVLLCARSTALIHGTDIYVPISDARCCMRWIYVYN